MQKHHLFNHNMEWSWKACCPLSKVMKESAKNIPSKAIITIALQAWPGDNFGAISRRDFYYQVMGKHKDPFIGNFVLKEPP